MVERRIHFRFRVGDGGLARNSFQSVPESRASAIINASEGLIPSAADSRENVSMLGLRSPRSMNATACRLSPDLAATSASVRDADFRASPNTWRSASESSVANEDPAGTRPQ